MKNILLYSLLCCAISIHAQVPQYTREISSYTDNPPITYFDAWGTTGIAVAPNGNVYVADRYRYDVQIFNSNGVYQSVWGCEGEDEMLLIEPTTIKIDANANVYIIEGLGSDGNNNNDIIKVYRPDGSYLRQLGSTEGSADGMFKDPIDMAFDASGNIYVADAGNNRVQVFTSAGTFITKWGSTGTGNGQFGYMQGISVDTDGNVYVTDPDNNRVQKFTSAGAFLTSWGTVGSGNGQFNGLNKIAIHPITGNIFTMERMSNYRIQEFTNAGVYINQWPVNELNFPAGLTFDAASSLYITKMGSIAKYSSTGTLITEWGQDIVAGTDDVLGRPSSIAVDLNHNMYVVGRDNQIYKYDANGALVYHWVNTGSGDGQFGYIKGIAVDATGNIYVADQRHVQKFDSDRNFITKWGSTGTGNGQFVIITAITVDASGYVYVVDASTDRVQKFTSMGSYISQWGSTGTANGQFTQPTDIEIDTDGNVYVADSYLLNIQKFSNSGSFITKWGSGGSSEGEFGSTFPHLTLTIDALNNIYVTDSGNERMQKFTNTGDFILKFGRAGHGTGEYISLSDIEIASDGQLYLSDYSFNQVLVYNTSTSTPVIPGHKNTSILSDFIYPNPSSGNFTADVEGEVISITLINSIGQREVYYSSTVSTTMTGLIIAEVKTDKGMFYQKVLVQ